MSTPPPPPDVDLKLKPDRVKDWGGGKGRVIK